MIKIIVRALLGAVVLLLPRPAFAQEKFPSRPGELTVCFGPGGGSDLMARKMSQLLEKRLGVPVPVNNVAGASGNAGLNKVMSAPPDGYNVATMIALTVSAWAGGVGYDVDGELRRQRLDLFPTAHLLHLDGGGAHLHLLGAVPGVDHENFLAPSRPRAARGQIVNFPPTVHHYCL